jgi:hypothetical protein
MMGDLAGALLAAIGLVAVFVSKRDSSREKTEQRIRELNEAAELLAQHASALRRFLDDPASPAELKALLIHCSDAMSDRSVDREFGAWLVERPLNAPDESEETRVLVNAFSKLPDAHPDLAAAFVEAITTAVMAALLRWPEDAPSIERVAPRIAISPARNVSLAVTATKLRSASGLGFRPTSAAMA